MDIKVIDAQSRGHWPALDELWNHRELTLLFVRRLIATRYRQMLLGSLWAVLEPLSTLLLMTIVFGHLLKVNTNGYPYPVFAFAGLIPWLVFNKTTMAVGGSLQENVGLISKVYFPRLILPIASASREIFDSLITVSILIVFAAAYGFYPTLKFLLLLPILLGVGLCAGGIGLWVAALMVRFRDVRPVLTIVLQAGMYLTPIVYSPTLVPARFLPVYQLNPMYWGVESFRWILLGKTVVVTPSLYYSMVLAIAMLVSGVFVFSLFEKATVDVQ